MQVAEKHHSGRSWPLRKAYALAGPAFLLLITFLFFWKLTLTDEYNWLDSPDLAYQVLPWLQVQATEWRHWRIPVWDPYSWNGQPLIGQAQPGVAYPLNWLLFRAPLHDGWIRLAYLNAYFVLIHFIAAWFCYLLCRDLRRSRLASIIAGCSFAFGGFMGSNDWPQMLNGACWAPLVLMFLLRVGGGHSTMANSAFAGAALGMAWLSGHHQIPIYMTLAAGIYWLYLIKRDRRLLLNALVFGVLLFMVSALQTLPAYEYGQLAKRWAGVDQPLGWNDKVPYQVHQDYSSGPLSVPGILFQSLSRNAESFTGIVAFCFALCGFIAARRKFAVRALALLAVSAFLFALGSKVVEHGMLYSLVPMLEKARNPAMALLLFHAGVAPLIAFGIDSAAVRNMKPLRWALLGGAGVLLLIIMGMVFVQKTDIYGPLVMAPFTALLLAAVLFLWSRGEIGSRAAKFSVLALLLMELGNFTTLNYAGKYDKNRKLHFLAEHSSNVDILKFLADQPRPFRVRVDDETLPYNFGDWNGVETSGGYLASVSANLQEAEINAPASRDLFAVTYDLRKAADRPDQVEVFAGRSGLKVYKNPMAMPRAWIVHQARRTSHRFEKPNDPRAEATIMSEPPKLAACTDTPQTQWTLREPSHIALKTEAACRGLLVIADTYFPGWQAKVDGVAAAILEVNGAERGVVVEAGVHTVEMRYRPTSVITGAVLSLLGVLVVLGIGVVTRRRESNG